LNLAETFVGKLAEPGLDDNTTRQLEKDQIFDCNRYVNKVFSFQRHIRNLVKLGCSRKSCFVFEFEFVVTLVYPNEPSRRGEAPTIDAVTNLLDDSSDPVLGTMEAADRADSIRRLAEKALGRYSRSPKQIPPHAECTLLQYHKIHTEIRPFMYIGVSKLACYACSLYFDAHGRSKPDVPLIIRGTHGHVYPWQAPGDDAEEGLYADMLEKIQRVLGNIVHEFALPQRKLLESTVASGGSGGDRLADDETKSRALIFLRLQHCVDANLVWDILAVE
jgi:hypothetical protein